MTAFVIALRPHVAAPLPALLRAAHARGLAVSAATVEQRYLVAGRLDLAAAQRLAALVSDPLRATPWLDALDDDVVGVAGQGPMSAEPWSQPGAALSAPYTLAIDVAFRPGVTDNAGESVVIGAERAGIAGVETARTVRRYLLVGDVDHTQAAALAREVLANELVETVLVIAPSDAMAVNGWYRSLITPPPPAPPRIAHIALRDADDAALQQISRTGVLALDLTEMQAIQAHFRTLDRDPTDGELETLAQTWSEHCSHKTFKGLIDYHELGAADPALGDQTINSLIKHYLMRATDAVRQPWVLSAFVDNAGIVAFGDDDALSFKMETHNHPSALEPFGGANTGIGGVVRDVLGVSAQPIANLDVLCFGPADFDAAALPPGVLHPARIAEGVVAGVRDYGNKLGVPTVGGAVLYDAGYTRNPLVFCGTLGLAKRDQHRMGAQTGDAVVLVGGRTGRDGIHGATFSSEELTHDTAVTVGSAVQIGDPITEKTVIDVLLQAGEQGLYRAITDCGAGGLSSAVGELGEQTGVVVELRDVPLKYPGLQPWEVWLSEAQERMVVAVPPETLAAFQAVCAAEDVEATVIGAFTADQRLTVQYQGMTLVDLAMQFVHGGRPQRRLEAVWKTHQAPTSGRPNQAAQEALIQLLAHPNIASKEQITRTYDHLVQGRTVQGPLGGVHGDGPTDAAVLHIRPERPEAAAVGVGLNPRYGLLDPYWMALAACDEAVRNVVAVGGDPRRVALLDNFCWGDPRQPDRMAGLVRATAGCHDAAVAWGMPFISGKDSLNNEYRDANNERVPIPPPLLISALALMDDVRHTTTAELKQPGNLLYLVGETRAELGGSHWLLLHNQLGERVPRVNLPQARAIFAAVHQAIRDGLVTACHDLSEGGLGVAAAEMVLGSAYGLTLDLAAVPWQGDDHDDDSVLWSESPSRLLLEISPEAAADFEALCAGLPCARIGSVVATTLLAVQSLAGAPLIEADTATLRQAWRGAALTNSSPTSHEL